MLYAYSIWGMISNRLAWMRRSGLDVVAIAHAVVAQDVAVVPEFWTIVEVFIITGPFSPFAALELRGSRLVQQSSNNGQQLLTEPGVIVFRGCLFQDNIQQSLRPCIV